MKRFFFSSIVFCAGSALAMAQTAPKPATPAKPATANAAPAAGALKLPPGVPRVRGIVKTAFSLKYQDIKLGTGADAEPNKLYKVLYTGYLAADGHKFDSSDDHRQPLRDKDGKPVLGDDGKPKLGDAQPISFPQGFGRVIPGFDQGFAGMKIGGKRRLFIPWQLAYGAHGRPGPDPAHPGIPPKADLIFDIELVDVTDMPMPPNRQMPMHPTTPLPGHPPVPPAGAAPGAPGATTKPATPGTPPPASTPTAPAASPSSPASNPPAQPETKPATPPAGTPSTPPPSGSQPQTQSPQK